MLSFTIIRSGSHEGAQDASDNQSTVFQRTGVVQSSTVFSPEALIVRYVLNGVVYADAIASQQVARIWQGGPDASDAANVTEADHLNNTWVLFLVAHHGTPAAPAPARLYLCRQEQWGDIGTDYAEAGYIEWFHPNGWLRCFERGCHTVIKPVMMHYLGGWPVKTDAVATPDNNEITAVYPSPADPHIGIIPTSPAGHGLWWSVLGLVQSLSYHQGKLYFIEQSEGKVRSIDLTDPAHPLGDYYTGLSFPKDPLGNVHRPFLYTYGNWPVPAVGLQPMSNFATADNPTGVGGEANGQRFLGTYSGSGVAPWQMAWSEDELFVTDTWRHAIVNATTGETILGGEGALVPCPPFVPPYLPHDPPRVEPYPHPAPTDEQNTLYSGFPAYYLPGVLSWPTAIAAARDGTLWFVNTFKNKLVHITRTGSVIAEYGGAGPNGGQYSDPDPAHPSGYPADTLWYLDASHMKMRPGSDTLYVEWFSHGVIMAINTNTMTYKRIYAPPPDPTTNLRYMGEVIISGAQMGGSDPEGGNARKETSFLHAAFIGAFDVDKYGNVYYQGWDSRVRVINACTYQIGYLTSASHGDAAFVGPRPMMPPSYPATTPVLDYPGVTPPEDVGPAIPPDMTTGTYGRTIPIFTPNGGFTIGEPGYYYLLVTFGVKNEIYGAPIAIELFPVPPDGG